MSTPAAEPGLSAAAVAERVGRGEVNRVRRSDFAEYRAIFARNLLTLFNALVVPAAVALFALGKYAGAFGVSGMAATNLVLGLAQELRAKRHLDRLTLLAEGTVRVRRDGNTAEVSSGDVVRDDVVLLAAGDAVPADGVVLEARFLEVDEALLTGESDPVPRKVGDQLLSGSFCVAGEGTYRADKVGAASFAQQTALAARAYRYAASPLQTTINRFLRWLTAFTVALCAVYVVLYRVRGDVPADELAEMVAATVTSMIPQGLVLMTTLAFILGAVRMARRGAVVQRLSAVETMAAVDTLCMDKTGTLTTNRLKLERLHVLGGQSEQDARAALRLFASASLDRDSKSLEAIRAALGEGQAELVDQLPFKSQNRYSAVRVRSAGTERVLVLGAPEALKPLHTDTADVDAAHADLTPTGLRLLLFAEADAGGKAKFDGRLDGFSLRPLALLGLRDELRPEARQVLEDLAAQGMAFKILSGDNPETVRATVGPLARESSSAALRALAEAPVVTGAQLAEAPDRAALVRDRSVFGRVSPAQKVEIVSALRQQGRQVAMIGDGVNDVLPIKAADLGVAMGAGSGASKTVSGLVLETNDFRLLPQTLDEGRTILRNLGRSGKLFLVKNIYMAVLWVAALSGLGLPLRIVLPQQTPLLNALTIGVPALFIMFGRGGSKVTRGNFVRDVGAFVLKTGAVIAAAGLAVSLLARHVWRVDGEQTQRTILLTTLVLLGLDALLRVLSDDGREGSLDRRLRLWPVVAVLVYLLAMYVPFFAHYFELSPLELTQWVQVLGVVLPAAALARVTATSAAATPGGPAADATRAAPGTP